MSRLSCWRHRALAAGASIAPARAQGEVAGAAAVTGAGSTFAFPIVSKWSQGYQRWVGGGGDLPIAGSGLDDPPTKPVLDYEPIGSLGGTMRVQLRLCRFRRHRCAADVRKNCRSSGSSNFRS